LLTNIKGKAVGIDISEYCVQKAQEKTKDKENTTVSQGSVFDINPDDFDTFQTIVSLDVFPLIEEKESALEKCSSVLNDNGTIFMTDYFAPPRFERVFTPYGGAPPYSRKDYEQAIDQVELSLANLRDRTDKCLAETRRITEKMNENSLKGWMIENWGQKYYDYAVELAEEWTAALENGEITYDLLQIES